MTGWLLTVERSISKHLSTDQYVICDWYNFAAATAPENRKWSD